MYPPQYTPPAYQGPPPCEFPPAVNQPPASPRPKSAGTALIIGGIVLFCIVGLATLAVLTAMIVYQQNSTTPGLALGDCVAVDAWTSGAKSLLDIERIDCSSRDALEQLVGKADTGGQCPDGKRGRSSEYEQVLTTSTLLCFEGNMKEGQCYTFDMRRGHPPITNADCTETTASDSTAVLRVVKRIDGSTDTSVCPADSKGLAYARPARTYCVQPAQAG